MSDEALRERTNSAAARAITDALQSPVVASYHRVLALAQALDPTMTKERLSAMRKNIFGVEGHQALVTMGLDTNAALEIVFITAEAYHTALASALLPLLVARGVITIKDEDEEK